MKTKLIFKDEARQAVKKGIDIAANAVRATIGPRGRNVAIDNPVGTPTITNDGVSILKRINLEGRYEQMGVEIVKEAASKTNDSAGDGTSSTTVLLHALVEEGMRKIDTGINVVELKRGMEKACEAVVTKLVENSVEIVDSEQIKQIATISAESEEMGTVIAEAIEKIGPDGVITVEESHVPGITSEVVEGMKVDSGFISPYMVTNPERMEAVYEGVRVLVVDGKLNNMKKFMPILEKLAQDGRNQLVVIAEEVQGEVLSTLVVNKLRGALNVLAVKAPGYGDNKTALLEDIAALTGATVVSENKGHKLEDVTLDMMGIAKKVIATEKSTTIVEGSGDTKERVVLLKAAAEKEKGHAKELIDARIANLTGGIGVIKVGASTETEMQYIKHKIEDAVSATQAAVEEGIVAGGGSALVLASWDAGMPKLTEAEKTGYTIVCKACTAPINAICKNAGKESAIVVHDIVSLEGQNAGYDANTDEVHEDMIKQGIVDPVKVTRNALQNAVSAASTFLTTEVAIGNIIKDKKD